MLMHPHIPKTLSQPEIDGLLVHKLSQLTKE